MGSVLQLIQTCPIDSLGDDAAVGENDSCHHPVLPKAAVSVCRFLVMVLVLEYSWGTHCLRRFSLLFVASEKP